MMWLASTIVYLLMHVNGTVFDVYACVSIINETGHEKITNCQLVGRIDEEAYCNQNRRDTT